MTFLIMKAWRHFRPRNIKNVILQINQLHLTFNVCSYIIYLNAMYLNLLFYDVSNNEGLAAF